MGKVITFSNQKGGSGKSTLSANVAVLWSNSGYKVAVIDADPQNSLTYWLSERKTALLGFAWVCNLGPIASEFCLLFLKSEGLRSGEIE